MNTTLPSLEPTPAPADGVPVALRFTDEETAYLTGIANRLGWTLPRFLQAFIHDDLPLQRMHRTMPGAVTAKTVHVEVLCGTLATRLERVAAFNGMEIDDWLLWTVGRQLELQEEQMIFEPKTGDVIGDARRVFKAVRL